MTSDHLILFPFHVNSTIQEKVIIHTATPKAELSYTGYVEIMVVYAISIQTINNDS